MEPFLVVNTTVGSFDVVISNKDQMVLLVLFRQKLIVKMTLSGIRTTVKIMELIQ